jgi:hypothetical protein
LGSAKGEIFCHVVGLSCEGFEEQMLALFATVEASRNHNSMVNNSTFSSNINKRGKRELKEVVLVNKL